MNLGSFKNKVTRKSLANKSYISMYKQDVAINNLKRLVCHNTQSKIKVDYS